MPLGLIGAGDETAASPDAPGLAWADQGACRGSGHLFFTPDRERPGRRARREWAARELCATCPVLLACRTWARQRREYGFWGGEAKRSAPPPGTGRRWSGSCGLAVELPERPRGRGDQSIARGAQQVAARDSRRAFRHRRCGSDRWGYWRAAP
jgi:WhiB family redox-sensing transcriptional regulator